MTQRILTAETELERLLSRSVSEFVERVLAVAREYAAKIPHQRRIAAAVERLGALIGGNRAIAWMLGRRRVLLEADRMRRFHEPALAAMAYAAEQTLLPRVDPETAIADMIEREPRLADGYREVQRIMSREHAYAAARAESLVIAEKVRDKLAQFLRRGVAEPRAKDIIAEMTDWAQAYAGTVFRTNVASAYASGRFREATSDHLRGFIVGLERLEVMDAETKKRPGHWHAHGLVAAPDDPIWHRLSLPGGYNCRGTYRLIDVYEARRRGLMKGDRMRSAPWPPGAYNDPGFDHRVMHPAYGLL